MLKKIYCPTDLSTSANNAIEYAAKLAQASNASLHLLSVQAFFPIMAATAGVKEKEIVAEYTKTLSDMSLEVSKTFNIFCDYKLEVTTTQFEKILTDVSGPNDIIVMGTNGVDNDYQYFFGSNTYNAIKRSNCPILVIPENVTYGTIQQIVFAWDYSKESKISLTILKDYINIFNPKIILLHVSKNKTQISKDVFTALKEEIEPNDEENKSIKTDFEFRQIYSENIPEAINEYMKTSAADMLTVTYYHRGVIADLFHGKVAKELSETANYPVLVINE